MTVRTQVVAILLSLAVGASAGVEEGDATALRRWVGELSAKDAGTRRAGAEGLASLGRQASGEAASLLPLVEDDDVGVRLEALAALLAIRARGNDVAVAAWRSLASDADPTVRGEARRLSRKLHVDAPPVARALRRALQSEHADARRAAATRLGQGEARARGDLEALLGLVLDDSDEHVRAAAVRALAEFDSPLERHQGALRDRLASGDEAMQLRAAGLFREAAPLEDESLRALADLVLSGDSDELARLALAPLRRDGRAHPALAGRFLAELGRARGTRLKFSILALGALGVGSPEEVAVLFEFRLDRDAPRAAALKSLARLARERGALALVADSLASPLPARRIAAAEVLDELGDRARTQGRTLSQLARADPEPGVRSAALKALVSVGPAAVARPVVENALKDRSSDVRSTARVQQKVLNRAEERRERREAR